MISLLKKVSRSSKSFLVDRLYHQFVNFLPRLETHSKIFKSTFSPFSSDSNWHYALAHMRNHGFARLPPIFISQQFSSEICDAFNQKKYNSLISSFTTQHGFFADSTFEIDSFGKCTIPMRIPLDKEVFSSDFLSNLHLFLSSYYNQKYWLRNEPVLALDLEEFRENLDKTDHYHVDFGFHQTTLVVLLNDIDESSTSTKVIPQTHKRPHLFFELFSKNKLRFSSFSKSMSYSLSQKFGEIKFHGKAGDVYIFDPGNLYHKASWGSNRLMLHFTFAVSKSHLTSGYTKHLKKFGDLYTKEFLSANQLSKDPIDVLETH